MFYADRKYQLNALKGQHILGKGNALSVIDRGHSTLKGLNNGYTCDLLSIKIDL